MKFFLDTANLDEIRQAAALGLADGVTTNPTLIAKEGNVDFKQHIAEICKIVSGPVSAETTSDDRDEMLKQGREYVKIAPNVVIKVPLTVAGLEATRIFDQEGIKVNVTLCFSAAQAVCAAKAGASFIRDRKSTRLNSSHGYISYAVFCLKKKKIISFTSYVATAASCLDAPSGIRSGP